MGQNPAESVVQPDAMVADPDFRRAGLLAVNQDCGAIATAEWSDSASTEIPASLRSE